MRHLFFLLAAMLMFSNCTIAQQQQEPWSKNQLMEPGTLASWINAGKAGSILILTVGPDAVIKGSVDIGPAQELANIEKLKSYLSNVPKDKEVVIYCGCCPFDRCPNVRPAFKVLKDMGFKNPRLLNLSKNVKADWLDKGYPTND